MPTPLTAARRIRTTATHTATIEPRTVATFTCSNCHRERPITDRSLHHPSYCVSCFETGYFMCRHCGGVTRRGQAHMYEGDAYCRQCYNDFYRPHAIGCCHWNSTPMDVSIATYDELGSTRKYGVEIETDSCPLSSDLYRGTCFGAKTDCSVNGLEFDSPILYGDEGLAEIRKILAYANAHDWEAGSGCGCHTHYDMRGESNESMGLIIFAYRLITKLLRGLTERRRHNNTYCRLPSYYSREVRRLVENGLSVTEGTLGHDRYVYLNISSYNRHHTFEVRILEGTVDAELVCNWIKFNARFMDWAKTKTFDELNDLLENKSLAELIEVVGTAINLKEWMLARRAALNNGID